jgi:hypothetical protein
LKSDNNQATSNEDEGGDEVNSGYKSAKKNLTDEHENRNDAALKSGNYTTIDDEDGDKENTEYKSAKKTATDADVDGEDGGASKKNTKLESGTHTTTTRKMEKRRTLGINRLRRLLPIKSKMDQMVALARTTQN